MAWTYNNIRIFVQESREEGNQIIPRLQPLSGGTTLQIFGHEDIVRSLSAIVIGDVDKNALIACKNTGTAYTLVGPEVTFGSYYLKSIAISRMLVSCQTIRPDLDEDAPVYNVELQLYSSVIINGEI